MCIKATLKFPFVSQLWNYVKIKIALHNKEMQNLQTYE